MRPRRVTSEVSAKRVSWTGRSNTRTGSPPINALTSTSPIGRTTGSRCGATEYGREGLGASNRRSAERQMNVSGRDEQRNEKGAQIMRKEGGAMKKLLLLGVGSALMFTMGGVGPAQADTSGDTHKSTSILEATGAQLVSPGAGRCASCHRAHTAKAEMLLKDSQPALCYSCHGGAGTFLDVVDGVDPNDSLKALRGGGFAYAK